MFTGEQLLRSVSFGGLLLTLALILHHRSMPLALLYAFALVLVMYIEWGGGAEWLTRKLSPQMEHTFNMPPPPTGKREL
jgi:hypothetical protein